MSTDTLGQLLRDHHSRVTLHHSSDAIPGGSPEVRTSDAGVHYLLVSEVLGTDLPPPHVIEFTLEAYVNATHWFMILFHEPSLRLEVQRLQETGYLRADRLPVLILVILVIAIGAKYATAREANERCPGYDLADLGTRFIRKVEEKLLEVYDDAGIEAVQISMILSSYYIYHSRPTRSFAVLGSGLKMAQSLGLPKESSWKVSDPTVREVWRRLYWALFTSEVCV